MVDLIYNAGFTQRQKVFWADEGDGREGHARLHAAYSTHAPPRVNCTAT